MIITGHANTCYFRERDVINHETRNEQGMQIYSVHYPCNCKMPERDVYQGMHTFLSVARNISKLQFCDVCVFPF